MLHGLGYICSLVYGLRYLYLGVWYMIPVSWFKVWDICILVYGLGYNCILVYGLGYLYPGYGDLNVVH